MSLTYWPGRGVTAGVFATPQTITLTSGQLLIADSVTISAPGAN